MSGSTRKLHKQKGGGGSRIGDINSPVLVGGGRVFGPRPRDYRFKLNKKLKALARRSALSAKAQEGQIIVVDGKKLLLVLSDKNNNVYLSSRNVPNVHLMNASDINTYALLNNNAIIMTEGSVELINNSK